MAKQEQEVGQTSQGNEEMKDPVAVLTEHLRSMAQKNCRIAVGENRRTMLCGEVADVRVEPVWAYFTIGTTGYRTTTKADKEALLRGETSVHLTKMFERPAPEQSSVKPTELRPRTPFIPRSQRSFVHGVSITSTSD